MSKLLKDPDGAQDDQQTDDLSNMGQRNEPEPLPSGGAIHHCRLVLLLRDGLQGGEDIHHEHWSTEPDVDEQRHPEGRRGVAQQRHVLISETESGRKIGQDP